MKRTLHNITPRQQAIIVCMTLSLLVGAYSIRNFHDLIKVQTMTQTMKTMCVGRFLIDVPVDAPVSFRPAFLSGWTISTSVDETDQQFAERLAAKEAELKATRNEKGWESLETVLPVKHEMVQGKVFVFDRTWSHFFEDGKRMETQAAAVHGYLRIEQTNLTFTAKYLDTENARELVRLATQVRAMKEGEIPTAPGFCFGRAMLLDPLLASQNERVTMFVGIKDHPDISIVLDTAAGLKPDRTLLGRANGVIRQQHTWRFHNFRRGSKNLAGLAGEELLEKVQEDKGLTVHNFQWESFDKRDDVFTPRLSLELGSGYGRPGKLVGSSLWDDAILALWDKLADSLRVRPTILPVPEVAPGPGPAPASTARSGEPCPSTGWWRCTNGAGLLIAGGERQFFTAGTRLPQARLAPPSTLWQRLRKRAEPIPSRWVVATDTPPVLPPT